MGGETPARDDQRAVHRRSEDQLVTHAELHDLRVGIREEIQTALTGLADVVLLRFDERRRESRRQFLRDCFKVAVGVASIASAVIGILALAIQVHAQVTGK